MNANQETPNNERPLNVAYSVTDETVSQYVYFIQQYTRCSCLRMPTGH